MCYNRHMERLIDIDTFIKQAKKRGVDFGKGNPYNRIRYYTKIGLLPHMTRKKEGEDTVKGHYPVSVLDRLEYVEELKEDGLTNEEIIEKLETKTKSSQFSSWLKAPNTRNQFVKYGSFIMLALVLFVELGVVRIGAFKQDIVPSTATVSNPDITEIIQTGTAFMPSGRNSVFVKAAKVKNNSKIYVAFKDDYSPAVRYWVSDIVDNAGFYINTDSPSYNDAEFNWWITP